LAAIEFDLQNQLEKRKSSLITRDLARPGGTCQSGLLALSQTVSQPDAGAATILVDELDAGRF
jgi:hypothetical protein